MNKLENDADLIKFVDHLDKLRCDLSQLNLLSEVANTTVISEIESKLPNLVQRDWIKIVSAKEMASKSSSEIFEQLLTFLEDTKRQAEYFGSDVRQISDGVLNNSVGNKVELPPRSREPLPCIACVDGSTDVVTSIHSTNSCEFWRRLNYDQKRQKVRCVYHPSKGLLGDHTTEECRIGKAKCLICKENNQNGHHTWFCHQV